jgi:Mg-chelatase subunit ChlD
MGIEFLTPIAGALAATLLLTLGVYLGRERRGRRVRSALGLSPRRAEPAMPVSLALVPALLGLAATQPVIEASRERSERTDAQVFVALDTSRSMLASSEPGSLTRIERAGALVEWLARSLPEVPVGLAGFDGTMLPYVFPTTDVRVLSTALSDSLGIERGAPLPETTAPRQTTSLDAIAAIPRASYFAPTAERRLLMVLTDGETNEIEHNLARAFQRRPRIETIFVRLWGEGERVYTGGVAEPAYTPDASSVAALERVSSLVGGRIRGEDDRGSILADAERVLGDGPTRSRTVSRERRALMPYLALAALVPFGLVLLRRNV